MIYGECLAWRYSTGGFYKRMSQGFYLLRIEELGTIFIVNKICENRLVCL